jgi:hypothetical protein
MDSIFADFVSTGRESGVCKSVCVYNRQEYRGPDLTLPKSEIPGMLIILNNNLIEWDVIFEGDTVMFIYNGMKTIRLDDHFYNISILMMHHLDTIVGRPVSSLTMVQQSTVLFRAVNTVIVNVVKPENRVMRVFVIKIFGNTYTFHFKGCVVDGFFGGPLGNNLSTAFKGWNVTIHNGVLVFNPNIRNMKMFDHSNVRDAVQFLNRF